MEAAHKVKDLEKDVDLENIKQSFILKAKLLGLNIINHSIITDINAVLTYNSQTKRYGLFDPVCKKYTKEVFIQCSLSKYFFRAMQERKMYGYSPSYFYVLGQEKQPFKGIRYIHSTFTDNSQIAGVWLCLTNERYLVNKDGKVVKYNNSTGYGAPSIDYIVSDDGCYTVDRLYKYTSELENVGINMGRF